MMKTCSRCRQPKPLDEFKSDSRKPDGKASSCKACNTGIGYAAAGSALAVLSPYDQARRMLAQAKTVDDVKNILDRAAALKEYARRAKDRGMEIDAAEIRFHSERRFGQMIVAQKENFGLHKGGRPATKTDPEKLLVSPIRLEEMDISNNFSSHAQKMAAVPEADFNARIDQWREEATAAKTRVTVDLLKIGEAEQQRQSRHNLAQALSDTSAQLSEDVRKVPCIYADPAVRRKGGVGDRAYENHYPTMTWDEIMALPVAGRLLPDAWGFIWLPRAHVLALHPVIYSVDIDGVSHDVEIETPLAWAIARAWGFDSFSTLAVWDKTAPDHPDEHGTGLIFWDQCEVLCLFKKGHGLPKPLPDQKFGSMIRDRARGHSEKPPKVRDMIVSMTGGLPVLELFARADPDHPLPENWLTWGNQAQAPSAEAAE